MTDFERDIYFLEIVPWSVASGKIFEDKKDMVEAFWLANLPEMDYTVHSDGNSDPFTQYDFEEEYQC